MATGQRVLGREDVPRVVSSEPECKMLDEVRAAGLVVYRLRDSQVEYLMLQKTGKDDHWSPPKGHVEPGESDWETALRETEEESGIKKADLEITDLRKVIKYDMSGRPKTTVFWLALLRDGAAAAVKLSNEHQAFRWLPLDEACRVSKPVVEELLRACDDFLSGR